MDMVTIDQSGERRTVNPKAMGSKPIYHPNINTENITNLEHQ